VLTTSISSADKIEPSDLVEGLVGGLTGLYVSVWGQDKEGADPDHLTPEEFCELISARVLARLLSGHEIKAATVQ
jgi:hypothetical protein